MQMLQTPAGRDEIPGQPVEQLRVAGSLPHHAEIIFRGHQAFAEMPLPDTVDDDARHQGMIRLGKPTGQPQAKAGRFRQRLERRLLDRGQNHGHAG